MSLKYLSNFCRTLALLPNQQVQDHFSTTDTKIYVLVVTLLTQDIVKLLQQLKEQVTGINTYQRNQ